MENEKKENDAAQEPKNLTEGEQACKSDESSFENTETTEISKQKKKRIRLRRKEQTPKNPEAEKEQKEKRKKKEKTPESVEAKKEARKKLRKAAARLLIKIAVIAIALVCLWTFVGEVHIIHSNSMYPNIKDGALIFTSKLADCIKGDIVLYNVFGEYKLGRIAAGAGDVVNMEGNGVYTVNDMIPYEMDDYRTDPVDGSGVVYPYKVLPGQYFLLNDLREDGTDSRIYGGLSESLFRGKVVLLIEYRGL